MIYVVDSCDRARFHESRDELKRMLAEDQLRNVPVLILANKQDLPGAANCTEITQAFEMHKIAGRDWYVQETCASNGDGLVEGLQWVEQNIKKNRSNGLITDSLDSDVIVTSAV